jgi:hypothetical protein
MGVHGLPHTFNPNGGSSCNRRGRYSVTSIRDNGNGGGGTVCVEHLYTAIAFMLGLPEPH